MSRTHRGAPLRIFAGRWRFIDRANLKEKARSGRRSIDRQILRRAGTPLLTVTIAGRHGKSLGVSIISPG